MDFSPKRGTALPTEFGAREILMLAARAAGREGSTTVDTKLGPLLIGKPTARAAHELLLLFWILRGNVLAAFPYGSRSVVRPLT